MFQQGNAKQPAVARAACSEVPVRKKQSSQMRENSIRSRQTFLVQTLLSLSLAAKNVPEDYINVLPLIIAFQMPLSLKTETDFTSELVCHQKKCLLLWNLLNQSTARMP